MQPQYYLVDKLCIKDTAQYQEEEWAILQTNYTVENVKNKFVGKRHCSEDPLINVLLRLS